MKPGSIAQMKVAVKIGSGTLWRGFAVTAFVCALVAGQVAPAQEADSAIDDMPAPSDHPETVTAPRQGDAITQGQGQALAAARGPGVMAGRAQTDGAVRALATLDESRGWEAVGRIDLGESGFCTGALIEDSLVLTAAHCLFDKQTGARIPADRIKFLAGWRNGRAAAYRGARRAVTHPQYVYEGHDRMDRVVHDLALIELDHPVRLTTILPFPIGKTPQEGDTVGIVSYAHDRSEVPALQRACHVLDGQPGVLVLSCSVDFGSSGAPIFVFGQAGPQIVSIVSAKAEYEGGRVALGSMLDEPLAAMRAEMADGNGALHGKAGHSTGGADDSAAGGAKFLRP